MSPLVSGFPKNQGFNFQFQQLLFSEPYTVIERVNKLSDITASSNSISKWFMVTESAISFTGSNVSNYSFQNLLETSFLLLNFNLIRLISSWTALHPYFCTLYKCHYQHRAVSVTGTDSEIQLKAMNFKLSVCIV